MKILNTTAFPNNKRFETVLQREQRLEMMEEWLKSHPKWIATKIQKLNILIILFYCIWNEKQARTKSCYETQYSDASQQQKQKIIDRDASSSLTPPTLGKINLRSILQHMLQIVDQLHSPRYSQFLRQKSNLETILLQCLQKKLLDVCGKEKIQLPDLLSIGGNIQSQEPGVYMPIFWDPTQPQVTKYYLYVGQSQNVQERICKHENPWNRAKNPSLHYHCWKPGMESKFVLLAQASKVDSPLVLNLLELWCSLIFQTLQSRDLEEYMPPGTMWTSCHLNIANPLWQGFSEATSDYYERDRFFKDLLEDADPMVREYYQFLAAKYHALKHSLDPELYGYWLAVRERCLAGRAIKSIELTLRTLRGLIGGIEKPVMIDANGRPSITFGYIKIRVGHQHVSLPPGTRLYVQGFLSQGPNPNRVALDALPTDPAIRFSIKVAGFDGLGKPFDCFLSVYGEKTVKEINTLIKRFEGESIEAIAKKSRRFVPADRKLGRPKKKYHT